MLPHYSLKDSNIALFEYWHNRPPSLDHLRPFECIVYSHILKERCPKQSKYFAHATKGYLICYDYITDDYRYYDFKRNVFDKTHHLEIKEDQLPTIKDFSAAFSALAPAPAPAEAP